MDDWDIFQTAVQLCDHYPHVWHPYFAEFSSELVRGIIPIGEWMRSIILINSDNIELGKCVVSVLSTPAWSI